MVRYESDRNAEGEIEARAGPPVLSIAGVREGARRLFPVAVFVVPFGIAFGAAALARGLTADQALAMSALVFAAAAQFAALDLWQAPLPLLSLALLVLAVNARHSVLGAVLAPWMSGLPRGKSVLALAFLSDANFAESLAARSRGGRDVGVLLGGGLILWAAWVGGTALGVLAGASAGDLDAFGVDVVMPAFFTSALVARLRGGVSDGQAARGLLLPIFTAGMLCLLLAPLLPAGWNIILAALVGGLIGLYRHAG